MKKIILLILILFLISGCSYKITKVDEIQKEREIIKNEIISSTPSSTFALEEGGSVDNNDKINNQKETILIREVIKEAPSTDNTSKIEETDNSKKEEATEKKSKEEIYCENIKDEFSVFESKYSYAKGMPLEILKSIPSVSAANNAIGTLTISNSAQWFDYLYSHTLSSKDVVYDKIKEFRDAYGNIPNLSFDQKIVNNMKQVSSNIADTDKEVYNLILEMAKTGKDNPYSQNTINIAKQLNLDAMNKIKLNSGYFTDFSNYHRDLNSLYENILSNNNCEK